MQLKVIYKVYYKIILVIHKYIIIHFLKKDISDNTFNDANLHSEDQNELEIPQKIRINQKLPR